MMIALMTATTLASRGVVEERYLCLWIWHIGVEWAEAMEIVTEERGVISKMQGCKL